MVSFVRCLLIKLYGAPPECVRLCAGCSSFLSEWHSHPSRGAESSRVFKTTRLDAILLGTGWPINNGLNNPFSTHCLEPVSICSTNSIRLRLNMDASDKTQNSSGLNRQSFISLSHMEQCQGVQSGHGTPWSQEPYPKGTHGCMRWREMWSLFKVPLCQPEFCNSGRYSSLPPFVTEWLDWAFPTLKLPLLIHNITSQIMVSRDAPSSK